MSDELHTTCDTGPAVVADAGPDGLRVRGLGAGYYGSDVVFDVDLDAPWGRVTALFGHNGAGKTTVLRTILGLVALQHGSVTIDGQDVGGWSTRAMVRRGLSYLPEDRATFPGMSVQENLEMGAIAADRRRDASPRMRRVFELFPVLGERRRSPARTLSGGQARMLSIGMAIMADASILLLDEPSLGLAPSITQDLLRTLSDFAHQERKAIVLVEQAVGHALPVVDHVYVLRSGRIVTDMSGDEARLREDWTDVF